MRIVPLANGISSKFGLGPTPRNSCMGNCNSYGLSMSYNLSAVYACLRRPCLNKRKSVRIPLSFRFRDSWGVCTAQLYMKHNRDTTCWLCTASSLKFFMGRVYTRSVVTFKFSRIQSSHKLFRTEYNLSVIIFYTFCLCIVKLRRTS